jgi:hypothetical protein
MANGSSTDGNFVLARDASIRSGSMNRKQLYGCCEASEGGMINDSTFTSNGK